MKRCPDCGESKSLDEFPRNKNCKDGRHPYCKPCHNARGKETYTRLYGGTRHYHLKRRYGIGADEFDALVVAQGGVCAICGKEAPEHVDHSHATGVVRGILCFNCNGGLGQFKDSLDALVNAIAYLGPHDPEASELIDLAWVRAGELSRTPG
jgi:Recombination endonuclease VII